MKTRMTKTRSWLQKTISNFVLYEYTMLVLSCWKVYCSLWYIRRETSWNVAPSINWRHVPSGFRFNVFEYKMNAVFFTANHYLKNKINYMTQTRCSFIKNSSAYLSKLQKHEFYTLIYLINIPKYSIMKYNYVVSFVFSF